jgi:hypothetical protein
MRKRTWMALVAVLALSVGIAWAENKTEKADKACAESATCCCCAKVCPK